jgi:hypothetical protein
MKWVQWLKLILGFLMLCGLAVFGLYLFAINHIFGQENQRDPFHNEPLSSIKYYDIDPDTIISEIEDGNTEVFQYYEERDIYPDHPSGNFVWSSEDYFAIARAHHFFLTGETADGAWKVFAPGDFTIDQCSDNMQGFDSATIIFYKREAQSFPVTYIEIRPLRELIASANVEYERIQHETWIDQILDNPDDSYMEALSIDGKINAERALQIAEEVGGAELRRKRNNDCSIWITYSTDDWKVYYSWGAGVTGLTVDINANDGTYEIERK